MAPETLDPPMTHTMQNMQETTRQSRNSVRNSSRNTGRSSTMNGSMNSSMNSTTNNSTNTSRNKTMQTMSDERMSAMPAQEGFGEAPLTEDARPAPQYAAQYETQPESQSASQHVGQHDGQYDGQHDGQYDGQYSDQHDDAVQARLLDAVMTFLESAEGRFTYHQAQLIRLACCGLNTTARLDEAWYVLERALLSADTRPASLPVQDAFNDSIMDLIETQADALSYCEGEILRRAARGCNRTELEEIAYLLRRARAALQG